MEGVGQSFVCKCGKRKGWIMDGKELPNPCPECGRRYKGVYNPKTLTIDAVEITEKSKGTHLCSTP